MVDSSSPDLRRAGVAAGRLLVAVGLVVAGLFAGSGVSAADTVPAPGGSSTSTATTDSPAIDDPTGCRIG